MRYLLRLLVTFPLLGSSGAIAAAQTTRDSTLPQLTIHDPAIRRLTIDIISLINSRRDLVWTGGCTRTVLLGKFPPELLHPDSANAREMWTLYHTGREISDSGSCGIRYSARVTAATDEGLTLVENWTTTAPDTTAAYRVGTLYAGRYRTYSSTTQAQVGRVETRVPFRALDEAEKFDKSPIIKHPVTYNHFWPTSFQPEMVVLWSKREPALQFLETVETNTQRSREKTGQFVFWLDDGIARYDLEEKLKQLIAVIALQGGR